ncbi:hypothetical protein GCM10022243_23150 [Saccharothrix violaceirubra]|uniref:Uncharacterized protein YndB with AHSA1/START domain n=1 Tax=Saccharothrix violaceirubra TaxID=413306 RepID=A0A7W7T1C9_9PSEU|nr:hypothetical protein [Saccharothrix violaceirubra]MBB4964746.1 uncharacterized protein YndB with AHSA1/START domain [Saccharothrix violaceirubra]
MSDVHVRRDIPALPDLVFATVAEPARLTDWLPEPLSVVGLARADILILSRHGTPFQLRLTADPDRLRLEWTALADPACTGRLQVALAGTTGSVAELRLACPRAPDSFAATLLEALGAEVERTFAPG